MSCSRLGSGRLRYAAPGHLSSTLLLSADKAVVLLTPNGFWSRKADVCKYSFKWSIRCRGCLYKSLKSVESPA